MAQDPLYNSIGQSYVSTRRPDPRIIDELVRLIGGPPGATICDVGAGSGNYTNALADRGYEMRAVEPSDVMRRQACSHEHVFWHTGKAEALPLPDRSVSGVICTLAVHHFIDLSAAAHEMNRICPEGPLVFFTMDPRRGQVQWFSEYFPEIHERDYRLFPAIDEFARVVAGATARKYEVASFPLPPDLSDQFMYAPWRSPEVYLDPIFRANTSGFAMSDQKVIYRRTEALADDLASGRWDRTFGQFRSMAENDAGFCFVAFGR